MLSERWALTKRIEGVPDRASNEECAMPVKPGSSAYSTRFDDCRDWLDEAHRQFVDRLFLGNPLTAKTQAAAPGCLVFVPRSRPECAHTVDWRNFDKCALVSAFCREQWFVQENAIDTLLGPTGRLQVRLRAEWVIGPPAIKCAGLRPRQEPECIVTATVDVPLESREPRMLNCVVCYDDARIAA